jgi:hypothetical protein
LDSSPRAKEGWKGTAGLPLRATDCTSALGFSAICTARGERVTAARDESRPSTSLARPARLWQCPRSLGSTAPRTTRPGRAARSPAGGPSARAMAGTQLAVGTFMRPREDAEAIVASPMRVFPKSSAAAVGAHCPLGDGESLGSPCVNSLTPPGDFEMGWSEGYGACGCSCRNGRSCATRGVASS